MIDLEKVPSRADIEQLQSAMAKLPQAEIETRHYFADGMYIREMRCKAGTAIVGKVHKREHFFILLTGDMTLVSDGKRERVKAPRIMVASPGMKRVGYAHEDSICLNVHRTNSTDLEQIEYELIEEDPTALFDARNELKHPVLEQET